MAMAPQQNHSTIRSEMSSWLESFPWDLWGTYTFSEPFSPKSARRAMERHLKRVQNNFGKVIPYAWFMEPHKHIEQPHFHSLLGDVSNVPLSAKKMYKDWKDHQGHGRVDFEKYIEDKGVDHYLTKYVVKSNFDQADWDIRNVDKFVENSQSTRSDILGFTDWN